MENLESFEVIEDRIKLDLELFEINLKLKLDNWTNELKKIDELKNVHKKYHELLQWYERNNN